MFDEKKSATVTFTTAVIGGICLMVASFAGGFFVAGTVWGSQKAASLSTGADLTFHRRRPAGQRGFLSRVEGVVGH